MLVNRPTWRPRTDTRPTWPRVPFPMSMRDELNDHSSSPRFHHGVIGNPPLTSPIAFDFNMPFFPSFDGDEGVSSMKTNTIITSPLVDCYDDVGLV